MKAIGIIPARFPAHRFPGKPLTMIKGKTMIQRVYEQAKQSKSLEYLVVATDDKRIFDHVQSFNGEVIMTSNQCQNGTERCAEALTKIQHNYDVVINIQGDEPILNPDQIDQLVRLLEDNNEIATLAHQLNEEEYNNENVVKVAITKSNIALTFSRDYAFITNQSDDIFKHIGLYGFKTRCLHKLVSLQQSPNELLERLEQLRWIDHGYQIKVGITPHQNYSVDVPEDVNKILSVLNSKK